MKKSSSSTRKRLLIAAMVIGLSVFLFILTQNFFSPVGSEGLNVVTAQDAKETNGESTPAEVPDGEGSLISKKQAENVADFFAGRRWQNVELQGVVPAYAPDGRRESFICVYSKSPNADLADAKKELQDLRQKRLKLEQQLPDLDEQSAKRVRAEIEEIWSSMRQAKNFCTVITGGNREREPFLASFEGLPPSLYVYDDAVEKAAAELGATPQTVDMIFMPPMFIYFKCSSENGTVVYQAQGKELQRVNLNEWKRPAISEDVLEKRLAKWNKFNGANDVGHTQE